MSLKTLHLKWKWCHRCTVSETNIVENAIGRKFISDQVHFRQSRFLTECIGAGNDSAPVVSNSSRKESRRSSDRAHRWVIVQYRILRVRRLSQLCVRTSKIAKGGAKDEMWPPTPHQVQSQRVKIQAHFFVGVWFQKSVFFGDGMSRHQLITYK